MTNRTIDYEDLEKRIKEYLSEEDQKEIKKAYLYAKEKHKGQYRKTGEEYIIHPLFVAYILTSINADKDTIIAALLHDVVEDTETSKNDIKEKFGEKSKKEYKDLIWEDIKKINQKLPVFKRIKELIITTEPLEKTTTQKIKRFKEIEKINK